jgi:hypothetical protein
MEKPMIWLLCTTLVMVSGCFVLAPLFGKKKIPDSGLFAETELDRLLDREAVINKGLNDLEFEYKMGRLSEADFKQLETSYKDDVAAILQKIEQVEKEKENRRGLARSSKCPACGAAAAPGKKFCADCGHKF